MISCFNAYGTGAAFAIRQRIDDRSACASSSAGRLTMRFSWVGRGERVGDAVLLHQPRATRSGRTCGSTTIGAPSVWVSDDERQRAGVVQRAGREVHLVAELQAELGRAARARSRGSVVVRSAPFGLPVVPDV